jgi:hypothetical protein
MNPQCILGKAINHGPVNGLWFDAFSARPAQGLYALCDGANSCTDSGRAALWLCQQITDAKVPEARPLDFEPLVRSLHEDMLVSFPDTAATLVGMHITPLGLRLVSVGDSELALYERCCWGWGPWQLACIMPKDLDAHGHPSQLIASEVLDTVHQSDFKARGTWLALMMSDGPARVLPSASVKKMLGKITRQTPTSEDLDYFCQTLANEALASGCQDDVSIAMLWVRFGKADA